MYRRRKMGRPLATLLVALMVFSLVVPFAGVKAAEADSVSHLIDKAANILHSEFAQNGARNEDNGVGAYALYVLIQAGVDVSTWIYNGVPLKESVIELVYQDIAGSSAVPAKRLAQDLLAMKALGREDLVQQLLQILKSREGLHGFDSDIFSDFWVYDLLGRAGLISVVNQVYAREYILSEQNTVAGNTYGAWGFAWDGDFYPDFMATAQAVRVLAYLDSDTPDQEIQAAIERGMQWLKKQQRPDGSFAVSNWDDPLIDTVEMIATLKILGEDPASVKSAEGNSPVDYLLTKALNPDGTFGASKNAMDAAWALYGYYLVGARDSESFKKTFKDIQGHWAQKDVELMARRLIARGLSDDIFAPDQEVTRAQATAFLARSLGLEESNLKGTSFRDVPPQHWASQTIEAAYRAGLVAGTGEGNFEPERTITREEMAALLVRALKKEGWEPAQGGAEDKNNLAVYADSSEISPWARDSVKVCVSAGILRGRSAAELVPQGKITRAEAMVMLKRMLQVLGRIPDSP